MIVRALTTLLDFKFDRTNLDKFEQSLVGFKNGIKSTFDIIKSTVLDLFEEAKKSSNRFFSNSALAKYAGVSEKNVLALQNVFKRFGIDQNKFQGFFENLTSNIKGAIRGENTAFRQAVDRSQGAIELMINGERTNALKAIDQIFNYIRQQATETSKLELIKSFFQVDITSAQRLLNLISKSADEIRSLVKEETLSDEEIEKRTKASIAFFEAINRLELAFDKFMLEFGFRITEFINTTIKEFESLIAFLEKVQSVFDEIKNRGVGNYAVDKIAQTTKSVVSKVSDKAEQISFLRSFVNRFDNALGFFGLSSAQNAERIGMTNNIDINISGPVTPQQTAQMTEELKVTLNSFWDEKTREVMNNNPQVEK